MRWIGLRLGVVPTDSEETAFKDVDVALFVGAMPRKEGMERKDLLKYRSSCVAYIRRCIFRLIVPM